MKPYITFKSHGSCYVLGFI